MRSVREVTRRFYPSDGNKGTITNILCSDPNMNQIGWYCGNNTPSRTKAGWRQGSERLGLVRYERQPLGVEPGIGMRAATLRALWLLRLWTRRARCRARNGFIVAVAVSTPHGSAVRRFASPFRPADRGYLLGFRLARSSP